MNNKLYQPDIFNQVILICNSYVSFLNQKELVKRLNKFNLNNYEPTDLYYLFDAEKMDYYDELDYGSKSGLSHSTVFNLKAQSKLECHKLISYFENVKKNEIEILLTKERHFKRLKMFFLESNPDLKLDFDLYFLNFKKIIFNNNQQKRLLFDKLQSLTPSFVSFLNHAFNLGDGQKLAFSHYADSLLSHNKNNNCYQILNSDSFISINKTLEDYSKNKSIKFSEKDLFILSDFLNEFLSYVDLNLIDDFITTNDETKKPLAKKIVIKRLEKEFKFKEKLNSIMKDYQSL